jgi:hypothetical protein
MITTHITKPSVNRTEPKMSTATDRIFKNAAVCELLMYKM